MAEHVQKIAYTVDEFCQAFGVGRTSFYELVRDGQIKTRKSGRRTLVRAEDAKAWLDALPEGADQ